MNKKSKSTGAHSGNSSSRLIKDRTAPRERTPSDAYLYDESGIMDINIERQPEGFEPSPAYSQPVDIRFDGSFFQMEDSVYPPQQINTPDMMPNIPISAEQIPEIEPFPISESAEQEAEPQKKQTGAKGTNKAKSVKPPKPEKVRQPKERRKMSAKSKIGIIVAILVAAMIFGAALAAGYAVTMSGTTLPNVYADGIYIGGMDQDEALSTLDESGWDKALDTALRVRLISNVSFKIDRGAAGAKLTKEDAVKAAYSYGHTQNWLENLFEYIANMINPMDVGEANRNLKKEYIRSAVDKAMTKFNNATADNGYETFDEEGLLVLVKGAGSMDINKDELCAKIEEALNNGENELSYMTLAHELQMPDIDGLYKELAREPEDAYYDPDSYSVVEDIRGYHFDTAEAKRLWEEAAPAQKVKIPLEVTYPEITGDDMRALLFRDVLGSQLTTYSTGDSNRCNNLHIALNKINGIILNPGEIFSYNDTIGQRTEEAGFKSAGAYDDGQVVQEIGGGVCQVASTLYSATIFAQLKAVERTNHYFKVDYLDYGMDATVSWPSPNFRFQNTRDYPVKIVATYNDEYDYGVGAMKVEILGTDVDGSYVKVWRETWTISHPEFPDIPIGLSILQHRDVYSADGVLISSDAFNYLDEYYKHEEAYAAQVEARRNAIAAAAEGGGEG